MEPELPPLVAQAQRDQRRYLTRRLVPALGFLAVWALSMPVVGSLVVDSPAAILPMMVVWVAGLGAALAAAFAGSRGMQERQRILDEWTRMRTAREIVGHDATGAVDPMDALVERIVALVEEEADRDAVIACRDRARQLRADVVRARAALDGLPAGGEGSVALADAAERAEREAQALDDQLASVYAMLVDRGVGEPRPPVSEALGRLAAADEVDRLARAARAATARES